MNEDYKARVEKAIGKYLTKENTKSLGPKRKNKAPEKEVEKECLAWLRAQGFSVNILESKATYNPNTGGYDSQPIAPGYPDCSGNNGYGMACYIEFKAPGRRSTLRPRQREFLTEKIVTLCFAVVVDSVENLKFQYARFIDVRAKGGTKEAAKFLLHQLPKKREQASVTDLFPDAKLEG